MAHFWQINDMGLRPSILPGVNRLIWITNATIAGIVLASSVIGPFQISWHTFSKPAAASILLFGIGWFYDVVRKQRQIAAALIGTSQFAVFTTAAAPLSYVAASAARPLWDANFLAWDRGLGLDWSALLESQNAHPIFHSILALAYLSFTIQMSIAILALAWVNQLARLQLLILTFITVTIITIIVSAIMPAQGVWGHLQLSSIDYPSIKPITQHLHLSIFQGLREGTNRLLLAEGTEGIITFPSLHAALHRPAARPWLSAAPLRSIRLTVSAVRLNGNALTPEHSRCWKTELLDIASSGAQ